MSFGKAIRHYKTIAIRHFRTIRRTVRKEPLLKFIEWGGRLVYDAANPEVFALYCERAAAAVAVAALRSNADEPSEDVAPSQIDAGGNATGPFNDVGGQVLSDTGQRLEGLEDVPMPDEPQG
jgi:hypothetical protein